MPMRRLAHSRGIPPAQARFPATQTEKSILKIPVGETRRIRRILRSSSNPITCRGTCSGSRCQISSQDSTLTRFFTFVSGYGGILQPVRHTAPQLSRRSSGPAFRLPRQRCQYRVPEPGLENFRFNLWAERIRAGGRSTGRGRDQRLCVHSVIGRRLRRQRLGGSGRLHSVEEQLRSTSRAIHWCRWQRRRLDRCGRLHDLAGQPWENSFKWQNASDGRLGTLWGGVDRRGVLFNRSVAARLLRIPCQVLISCVRKRVSKPVSFRARSRLDEFPTLLLSDNADSHDSDEEHQ